MKIYRIYTIDTEYISSDVYDEDGYCDDRYDTTIEHEINIKYVDSYDKVKIYLNSEDDDYYYEEIEVE